jgi:hypothetical protein
MFKLVGRLRKISLLLVFGISRVVILNCGLKSKLTRMLHPVQSRTFSSLANFKIAYLINRLLYRGVQIAVGKRKKYSIMLVLDYSSYSSHISTRIAFLACYSQSSQIWHWCQHFRFEVFLGAFKYGHLSWCFNNMMWCLSCICDCSFHKMVSIHRMNP